MFITHKENVKPHILEKDAVTVSGIELMAYLPWFLCEVPEVDEENEIVCFTTILISEVETLAELVYIKKPVKAYLVSPGHINNSDDWALNSIKTIYLAKYSFESGISHIYRFETENGDLIDHDVTGMSGDREGLSFQPILHFN